MLLEYVGGQTAKTVACSTNCSMSEVMDEGIVDRSYDLLKEGYMKDWMDTGCRWKIQFIGDWANFLENLEGAIKPGSKLLINQTCQSGLVVRTQLDVHKISHNLLSILLLRVNVYLHLLLGSM